MLNSLDPDQARRIVRPDLGPNCLEMFSVDDKSCCWREKSYYTGKLLDTFGLSQFHLAPTFSVWLLVLATANSEPG